LSGARPSGDSHVPPQSPVTPRAIDDRVGLVDGLAKMVGKALMVGPRISPARLVQRRLRCRIREDDAIRVTTSDGLQLETVRIRARQASSRPTVLICHGWLEVKECHLHQANLFADAGHDVILYDHRAHGRSTGRYCTFGVLEQHDARAVIDEAERQGWLPNGVVTMGLSLGAATVILEAPTDDRVRAVIAIAPFTSFTAAIDSYRQLYVPFIDPEWAVRGLGRALRDAGARMEDADVLAAAGRLHRPALVAVGDRDKNLPARRHGRRVWEAVGRSRATFFDVPGADHFNVCRRRWPGFDETLLAFVKDVSR